MKQVICAGLAASLAGGCGDALMKAYGLSPVVQAPLTGEQTAAIEAGVRGAIKDPASAQFGGFIGGHNEKGAMIVCGYVNARNSFGGYTGPQAFSGVLSDKGFAVSTITGSDASGFNVTEVGCRNQNLPLDGVAKMRT